MGMFNGSVLKSPLQADSRGTFATTADDAEIAAQAILAVCETRQGERVMLPDFGLPDFVFEVMDTGLAHRVAFWIEQQVLKYVPEVSKIKVTCEVMDNHQLWVSIKFVVRGQNTPRNLTFPVWRLANREALEATLAAA
ncbi:MAG: GPW/gp25 family protein [Pyrinomonadaceae bacterium]